MASKIPKAKIYFLLAAIGFNLLLGQPHDILALTSPVASDMPSTIELNGKRLSLQDLKNPVMESNQTLLEGSKIYIKNCVLCHGDLLDGKGLFGESFSPPPANFLHPQSILSKPQSYSYWRIMKGGLGMPKKYNPWDSAMPAWEGVLKEDEVWKVIQYIYRSAKEKTEANTQSVSKPSIETGEKIYFNNCAICEDWDSMLIPIPPL